MINLKKKIEMCLNKYPEARNSDITLTEKVWWEFHHSKIKEIDGESYVKIKDLYDLPREDNIKRLRAKLNSEGKYMPTSPEVLKRRRLLEQQWHEEMSPSNPSNY